MSRCSAVLSQFLTVAQIPGILDVGLASTGDLPRIPHDILFGNPDKAGPWISPQGT